MNDITNTEIFNVVFRTLQEHGLILVKTNIEDEKQKAYNDCLPIIKRIQENHTNLNEYLVEVMKILQIDTESKGSLEKMFQQIIKEIDNLQFTNTSLDKRLRALENDTKLKEANCISYDLLWLFLFYYVEPTIDRVYPGKTWNEFTSKLKFSKRDFL